MLELAKEIKSFARDVESDLIYMVRFEVRGSRFDSIDSSTVRTSSVKKKHDINAMLQPYAR